MFSYEVDEEITLRLLEKTDAQEIFNLIDRSREHLRQWLGWIDGTKTVKDSERFIDSTLFTYENRTGLTLGISYKGKLAGVIGFNTFDWTNQIGVIGYWLSHEFIGKGIMTRAVRAIVDYGFQQLGLNRIEIRAAYENVKSRAIPERLGFQMEGQIRQGEWLYDHYVDLVVYGMLAHEWESQLQER